MSLRYGTVPIVRETGGLKDTVEPYNEYEKTGTGFSFMNYNAHEMLATVRYAEQIYYDKKRDWKMCIRDSFGGYLPYPDGSRFCGDGYRCIQGCRGTDEKAV